ncbi:MAG: hypothetical protein MUC88_19510 [Planctomycetes bacterium]|jgi:general secretion pathway protein D|nr:hypothetical protein [Planctomycetota bacterium]
MARARVRPETITLLLLAALLLTDCASGPENVYPPAQDPNDSESAVAETPERAPPRSAAAACESADSEVGVPRQADANSPAFRIGAPAAQPVSSPSSGMDVCTAQEQPAPTGVPRVRVIQPAGRPTVLPETWISPAASGPPSADSRTGPPQDPTPLNAGRNGAAPGNPAQVCEPRDRRPVVLPDATDVVQLDLPSQLDLIQLLDLVGEYLQLDYLYDPEKLKGQVVTLKLHGKLQGQVQVRELYLLLESVLKFKGFAMTCHEGNLVTIVPAVDALKANPELIAPDRGSLAAGDMVVTDIFDLHHMSVSAASTLLQNMQLSLAVTPVEGAPALIVTCYAHQIERIEQLLHLVDRPGPPREFRFRTLRHTMAEALMRKIQGLVPKLGSVSLTVATPPAAAPTRGGGPPAAASKPPSSATGPVSSGDSAYLDADGRTNRLLLIGTAEQLAVVEQLVDALDVAQQDLRVLKIYDVQHVEAQEIKKKLQELEILGEGVRGGMISVGAAGKISGAESVDDAVAHRPVVVVLEATNSLIINAREEQHARVEAMMTYLDAAVRTETIPYEIYSLENQSPENVAQVLEKIVHETVSDKDGKLQNVVRNAEEQIIIVPDKNTFSLIVYASRKNQEWISRLVETLDRRRPQVLIDVTLVEIRKMDEFHYDLNLVTSLPDLVETSGQTKQFYTGPNTTVVDTLEQSHRSRFVDLAVDSGTGTGFYADRHINALLKVVQTKNYGRVLAKPKVLVNDNETGTIKTADTTYVITKSAIPVTAGTAGPQNTLIETSVKYEPYDAGITLEITPHISDRVLRLEVKLNRSDFTSVTAEKPPDETSSDITTIVTVPDRSTIILGGMLRLNQTKSGSKVPVLGDLPLVGGLFRSISNNDIESRLYVFVRAEVIHPAAGHARGATDIEIASQENRQAFEKHEQEFQKYQSWPAVKPQPVEPRRILDAR